MTAPFDPHEADIFAENRQLRDDALEGWAEANRRAFTIDRLRGELAEAMRLLGVEHHIASSEFGEDDPCEVCTFMEATT